MKKHTILRSFALLLLILALVFAVVACQKKQTETPSVTPPAGEVTPAADGIEKVGVWENAVYVKDTALGEGEKTVTVKVSADGKEITFTLKTNAETLRAAMEEHNLIGGDEGDFGLYVKTVNGILADWNTDGYWWNITQNGEATSTGVDGVKIADGEQYAFTRTK